MHHHASPKADALRSYIFVLSCALPARLAERLHLPHVPPADDGRVPTLSSAMPAKEPYSLFHHASADTDALRNGPMHSDTDALLARRAGRHVHLLSRTDGCVLSDASSAANSV